VERKGIWKGEARGEGGARVKDLQRSNKIYNGQKRTVMVQVEAVCFLALHMVFYSGSVLDEQWK